LSKGQHAKGFGFFLMKGNKELLRVIEQTTIGKKRIITFPAMAVNKIVLFIKDQTGSTYINEVEAYLIDEKLIEK
jgi:alpha-L-fucosidase